MSPKIRFCLIATAMVLSGATTCLLMLTVFDSLLQTGAMLGFDTRTQALVHSWTNPSVTAVALALTWLGAIKIFAVGLGLFVGFIFVQGRRYVAVVLGLAITGAFLLNEGLKVHFHRARPSVRWSIGDEHTYSYPSGHSLFAVVLYGTLLWLAMREGHSAWNAIVALTLAIGIGISRIYLGMHWPTDVLAGWLAGGIWLATVIGIDRAWTSLAYMESDRISPD